ncbi:YncE family protein [Actinokineospora sp.]|uniref:YncE family protein n=1 Tax=Actinokineospora sp. TaxID=1872133 RepID=UPI00403805A8
MLESSPLSPMPSEEPLRRLVAALAVTTALAGCTSTGQPEDELMVSANPVAATAARSPAPVAVPAGTVLPLASAATAVVADERTRTLAVAVESPPQVRLYDLDALDRAPRTVDLPGPAETLTLAAPGGPVLAAVAAPGSVLRVDLAGGATGRATVDGTPVGAATYQGATLVAVRDGKGVAVLDGDRVRRVITGGLLSADQVFAPGSGAVVLDRLRNALFELDVAAGTVGEGLRAGQGATNGVVDRFGRVLVTDTRGGALLAFSLDPLLLRQRYPVPGAPYAIAYDPRRDLAWVTLTESNEVVGLHVAGEEPQQRYRFATVGQPNSVAVDPASGRVVIASANGGGVQVVQP